MRGKLFFVVLALLVVLISGCVKEQDTQQNKDYTSLPTEAFDNSCKTDKDCVLINGIIHENGCVSCGEQVINKKAMAVRQTEEFSNVLNDLQKINNDYENPNRAICPMLDCNFMSRASKTKCNQGYCEKVIISCEIDSDCSSLSCSEFNVPGIKEGFQSYCVEGYCKCMCYGCE